MPDPNDIVFQAAAFAARAHQGPERKDKETPYFSHPVRVCLVVRQVFGFDDPRDARRGAPARHHRGHHHRLRRPGRGRSARTWRTGSRRSRRTRACPTTNARRPTAKVLAAADWQVKVIKLADQYDNIGDCAYLDAKGRKKTAKKARIYLDAVGEGLPPEGQKALKLVEDRFAKLETKSSK